MKKENLKKRNCKTKNENGKYEKRKLKMEILNYNVICLVSSRIFLDGGGAQGCPIPSKGCLRKGNLSILHPLGRWTNQERWSPPPTRQADLLMPNFFLSNRKATKYKPGKYHILNRKSNSTTSANTTIKCQATMKNNKK